MPILLLCHCLQSTDPSRFLPDSRRCSQTPSSSRVQRPSFLSRRGRIRYPVGFLGLRGVSDVADYRHMAVFTLPRSFFCVCVCVFVDFVCFVVVSLFLLLQVSVGKALLSLSAVDEKLPLRLLLSFASCSDCFQTWCSALSHSLKLMFKGRITRDFFFFRICLRVA
jgi:hypothetical protein